MSQFFLIFHTRIAAKAVLLIAALGLLSAVANWFCMRSVEDLNHLNATLGRHVAPARLSLVEARAAIQAMGLAAYKTFAANDRDEALEFSAAIKDEHQAAQQSLANVLTYFPDRPDDIRTIQEKLDIAYGIAGQVRAAVLAGEREQARNILKLRFDGALDDTGFHMYRLINILGGQAQEVTEETTRQQSWWYQAILFVLIGGTAATLLAATIFAHVAVARPLQGLADVMTRLAAGDFNIQVAGLVRRDEVGVMARAVGVFRQNGLALRDADRAMAADRDRSLVEKKAMLNDIADAFEREIFSVSATLAASASELEEFGRAMRVMADESGRHARMATTVATETTGNATTVASAVQELSTTMAEIGSQVFNASDVVAEATRCSDTAVSHAAELVSAVRHIDQVATMITGIAGQTNLLALNATIEAARAGEAGRGFAVVAQEVKLLAAKTTHALAEIREKTMAVNRVIEGVQGATQAISCVVGRIENISGAIGQSVAQQQAASRRIAQAVDGAAENTRQVSSTVVGVSAFADQTRQGVERVLEAVAQLNRQAGTLQRDVEQFAARVRAA